MESRLPLFFSAAVSAVAAASIFLNRKKINKNYSFHTELEKLGINRQRVFNEDEYAEFLDSISCEVMDFPVRINKIVSRVVDISTIEKLNNCDPFQRDRKITHLEPAEDILEKMQTFIAVQKKSAHLIATQADALYQRDSVLAETFVEIVHVLVKEEKRFPEEICAELIRFEENGASKPSEPMVAEPHSNNNEESAQDLPPPQPEIQPNPVSPHSAFHAVFRLFQYPQELQNTRLVTPSHAAIFSAALRRW